MPNTEPLRSTANGAAGVRNKTPIAGLDPRSFLQKTAQKQLSDQIRLNGQLAKRPDSEPAGIDASETAQGGNFSSFMNGAGKYAAKGIGAVGSAMSSMNDTVSEQSLAMRNGISDAAINSGNPIAMAIGAAAKVVDAIGDATGFHIDDLDKDAAKDAGVSGGAAFLNNAMNALPGNSLLMAAFSPGKTKESKSLSEEGEAIESGYTGVASDIQSAGKLSGKRTLFGIGRNKINRFIDDTNRKVDLMNEIGHTNALRKSSNYGVDLAQQNLNRYAGTNYMMNAVGRNGMKLIDLDTARYILEKRKSVEKFQKGGTIGIDTNVLPEGSLHARLNHLSDINPDLEEATKKGIPVMAGEQGGELSQVAEIEHSELILRLEVTQKIEELMKDGSDEAMIEAGKLLCTEIIDNTQDNMGQITEEVEDGK